MAVARYDGYADWYDDWRKPQVEGTARDLAALLRPGEGPCLDLGCGTGLFLDPAGWHQKEPWWGVIVHKRVGMRRHPLADMMNSFIRAKLAIEPVAELGDRPVPATFAIHARKQS